MSLPNRQQLLTLLAQWRDGLIDEATVQETAEGLLENCNNSDEISHGATSSAIIEVLRYLVDLPALLVTKHDVDAIVDFLNTPANDLEVGWRKWEAYWNGVDEGERRSQLRDHPFYFV
jgi:hypothetical protein